MKEVRYGIIGLGNQGSTYIKEFFNKGKVANAKITALCDINPDKIALAKEYTKGQKIEFFTDYKIMLESGLVDAVMVETPHYSHPEIAQECLNRGIHALVEKPAGVYAKQVKEMNATAGKSHALFGMMFNQRTNCVYRKMREMIEDGEIGELQRVVWVITNWYRPQAYYDSSNWRATWCGEGGGVLINQCPHQLDLLQWVVGEMPETVHGFCGYGKWHDIEVEDEVTAYFRYKNGATGVFITTTGEAPGGNRLEISGTRGKLLCENDKIEFYRLSEDINEFSARNEVLFGSPEVEKIDVETDGENPQHLGIINNFTQSILGKEKLFVDGTDGLCGVELMNAIEYSGWHGGAETHVPVNEDEYIAELNKKCVGSRTKNVSEKLADTTGTY